MSGPKVWANTFSLLCSLIPGFLVANDMERWKTAMHDEGKAPLLQVKFSMQNKSVRVGIRKRKNNRRENGKDTYLMEKGGRKASQQPGVL